MDPVRIHARLFGICVVHSIGGEDECRLYDVSAGGVWPVLGNVACFCRWSLLLVTVVAGRLVSLDIPAVVSLGAS